LFFLISTKTWEQTQSSQLSRGFGSAAVSPFTSNTPKVIYSMGKSRDWMYSLVETFGPGASGLSQTGSTQASVGKVSLNIYIYICIFI